MEISRKLAPVFVDKRGAITKLIDDGMRIRGVLFISSKAGSVRANHYHKKDSHFVYMLSGKMQYYERPIKSGKTTSTIAKTGDLIYTPPKVAHAMKFLTNSEFLAFSTEPRGQKAYEADTVPLPIV